MKKVYNTENRNEVWVFGVLYASFLFQTSLTYNIHLNSALALALELLFFILTLPLVLIEAISGSWRDLRAHKGEIHG